MTDHGGCQKRSHQCIKHIPLLIFKKILFHYICWSYIFYIRCLLSLNQIKNISCNKIISGLAGFSNQENIDQINSYYILKVPLSLH